MFAVCCGGAIHAVVAKIYHSRAVSAKNALFAGHEARAQNWAILASPIGTCKLNGADPHTWLTQTLTAIANGHKQSDINNLMSWSDAPHVWSAHRLRKFWGAGQLTQTENLPSRVATLGCLPG